MERGGRGAPGRGRGQLLPRPHASTHPPTHLDGVAEAGDVGGAQLEVAHLYRVREVGGEQLA